MEIDEIKARLKEAADVIRRIPKVNGPQGYATAWPDFVRSATEAYGYDSLSVKPPPPSNDQIDNAWKAMEWLNYLDGKSQKMLWAWANGMAVWRLAQWHNMSEAKLRRWRDQSCQAIATKTVPAKNICVMASNQGINQ